MFLRNFVQFPPINDTPLYTTNIKPTLSFTKQTYKKIIGKNVWENHVMPKKIILTRKMQQNNNIQYAQLLNNLHENKITKNDFSLLKYPFLSKLQFHLFKHPWNEITYIFIQNELIDMINHHMIEYNSHKESCVCYIIVVKDTYKNKHLCEDV
jgi:hypothetical protein